MKRPLLTIGLIFRDDIRCIERCLRALQPLRDALPCEMIAADTGSTDGSRAVVEQYADEVFDFPWIDDFAAARNAVMDRGSAPWYFSVDTDEYLEPDIAELTAFFEKVVSIPADRWPDAATVIIRNYHTYEMDGDYADFYGVRLLNRATNARFVGSIHEHWEGPNGKRLAAHILKHTIMLHDGYVDLDKKIKRNLPLQRKQLEDNPENLLMWFQLVEATGAEPDFDDIIRGALNLVLEKRPYWKEVGPPIMRYAVVHASSIHLPELAEWIQLSEEWFPDSVFTRIDVEFIAFFEDWNNSNFKECIRRGERYLQALEDDRAGKLDPSARMFSKVQRTTHQWEQLLRVALAAAYETEKDASRAEKILRNTEFSALDAKSATLLGYTVCEIHRFSQFNTEPLIRQVWAAVNEPVDGQQQQNPRLDAFLKAASKSFRNEHIEAEKKLEGFQRHGYTVFLPLKDECEPGRAAAILQTDDPAVMSQKLAFVKNWAEFPIFVLLTALEHGAMFPSPDCPLSIEDMDVLASQMNPYPKRLVSLALQIRTDGTPQSLCWARAVILAAVQCFDGKENDTGMALARAFAEVERQFLPFCYSPTSLKPENLFVLPPVHRFGWYCVQAFDALESGDPAGYVRFLREGLNVCESMRFMVEFLIEHTPELQEPQAPQPSDELASLADQIRTILCTYAPDDPAVAVLKSSEAYQKVAYLIEGAAVPVMGGVLQ